jgi:alanine dehydrogenase
MSDELIRSMKRGSLLIDLRVSQGGCFETTSGLTLNDATVFEKYGVLHYCVPNVSNRVARTTSMAISNLIVPLMQSLGNAGSVQATIKSYPVFRNAVYMYCGKPVKNCVSNRFNLPSNELDLYLSAF